jgi:hypothetical protein
VTNNPFESLVEVAGSLQTLPMLRSLSVNLQTNEEVELILTSLPKLELLNGQGIIALKLLETEGTEELNVDKGIDTHNKSETQNNVSDVNEEDLNVTEEQRFDDLEAVVRIYDEFRAFQKRVNPSIDKVLEDEFEQKMSDMADELKEVLQEKSSVECKSACIIKVRHKILDLTSCKLADSINDKALSALWKNMRKEYNSIFEDLFGVIEQRVEVPEDTTQMKIEIKELSEVNKNLQKEVNKYIFEKGELKRSFDTERRKLMDRIALLERKNKKALNELSGNSKKSLNISARDSSLRTPSNLKEPKKSVCTFITY